MAQKSNIPSKSGVSPLFLPEPLLYMLLLGSIVLVYWRAIRFPFVQDDWSVITTLLTHDAASVLKNAFGGASEPFYRPVGQTYILLLYQLFHLQPEGYHIAALLLHWIASVLVVVIASTVARDRFTGWVAGFLYALSVTVFRDPLYWVVGAYDLLGMLFFLLAFHWFTRQKLLLSAASYALALLSKEGTIILPILLLLYARLCGEGLGQSPKIWMRESTTRLKYHGIVFVLYVILMVPRFVMLAQYGGEHVYESRLVGVHLLNNIVTYGRWCFDQLLFPLSDVPWIAWASGGVALVVLVLFLVKREWRRSRTLFALCWIVVGILPVLPFTHHAYRYYLIYSLPAFFLFLLFVAGRFFERRRRAMMLVFAGWVLLTAIFAERYTAEHDVGTHRLRQFEGSNNLELKATLINDVHSFLRSKFSDMPHNAVLVFNWLPTQTFGREKGPRIWYNDTTLLVFESNEVGIDRGGVFYTDRLMDLNNVRKLPPSVRKIYFDRDRGIFINSKHFGDTLTIGSIPGR